MMHFYSQIIQIRSVIPKLILIFSLLHAPMRAQEKASVTLAWNRVNDSRVGVYQTCVAESSRAAIGVCALHESSNPPQTLELLVGKEYFFRVKACTADYSLCSNWSNEVSKFLPYAKPVAQFSGSPVSGIRPLSVKFTSSSTGTIESYLWDFGDGTTGTARNPTHVYSNYGNYNVSLTVNGPGGSHTLLKTEMIRVNAIAPDASFVASVSSGDAPLSVVFTNNSSGDISRYHWDFGDGTSSTVTHGGAINHTFSHAGTYSVVLTASGPAGADSHSLVITVKELPPPVTKFPNMEIGKVQVSNQWVTVGLKKEFKDPVVIAKALSNNGTEPAMVRVANVTSNSFDIKVKEWEYLNQGHAIETLHYIVIEAGQYQLVDGVIIEANKIFLNTARNTQYIGLKSDLGQIPVVISTPVITHDIHDQGAFEPIAFTTRNYNADSSGFDLDFVFEESVTMRPTQVVEVHFLAIPQFEDERMGYRFNVAKSSEVVNQNFTTFNFTGGSSFFESTPIFVADLQSKRGGDPANLRWQRLNADGFQIKVSEEQSNDTEVDHSAESIGYVAIEQIKREGLTMEVGEVTLRNSGVAESRRWKRVDFKKSYINPIVVAGAIPYGDSDPVTVRVALVDKTGFWITLQEYDYLANNGNFHGEEVISYMVLEEGRYDLKEAGIVEAGKVTVSNTKQFSAVSFLETFSQAPVVITSVTSDTDLTPVVLRMRNISTTGLEVALYEEEAAQLGHASEVVTYIAWSKGQGNYEEFGIEVKATPDVVTQNLYNLSFDYLFSSTPHVFAQMQKINGSNTSNVRFRDDSALAVTLWIDEEQSSDSEVTHTNEVVGIIAVEEQ